MSPVIFITFAQTSTYSAKINLTTGTYQNSYQSAPRKRFQIISYLLMNVLFMIFLYIYSSKNK